MSIKNIKKEKVIKNIEKNEYIDIVAKINFKKEFLNININEKNYGFFIFGNKSIPNFLIKDRKERDKN